MKVRLIVPRTDNVGFFDNRSVGKFIGNKSWYAPLAMPTLAALTPPGMKVGITDENVETVDFSEKPDLVGITISTPLAVRGYAIGDEFRKMGVPVVLGGIHASVMPEEALGHADSVVVGEAEGVWGGLLADAAQRCLKKYYRASARSDLARVPVPRWELMHMSAYRSFLIQTSRGCPYNCSFCSVKAFLGEEYRFKPVGNVVREIRALQGLGYKGGIYFADDNFAANGRYVRELLSGLKGLKVSSWSAQVSVNCDPGILELMADAGCTHVFIGLESIYQKTLDSMNKGQVNKSDRYDEVIAAIHRCGMGVQTNFIVGHDSDSAQSFDEIRKFVARNDVEFPSLTMLTPYPGTAVARQLEAEGRILDRDWRAYDCFSLCFRPKLMSAEDLNRSFAELNREFYEYGALYRRLSKSWRRGILSRYVSSREYFGSMKRLRFSLGALLCEIRRGWFLLKCLWHLPNPRFSNIFMAVTYHDVMFMRIAAKKTAVRRDETDD